MTIIIFLVILALLILSHELGHFLAAKRAGIRVDEFGFGFPPRLLGWKRGETTYSINLIPFGGFVKIFGENPDEESIGGPDRARSLVHKPRWIQAIVLAAGVAFNLILAWILISLGFLVGLPTPADQAANFQVGTPPKLMITAVLPGSPALAGGLAPGDELVYLRAESGEARLDGESADVVELVQNFIAERENQTITVGYRRGKIFTAPALPVAEAVVRPTSESGDGPAVIGIGLDRIVIARAAPLRAGWEGAKLTVGLTIATARAIGNLVVDALRGQGNLAAVTGPVGLVGLVGDARTLGFVYLLSFTALISINLAIINLVPFPALDGGRLLFLIIEKVKGSPIKPSLANKLNIIGFALLLALMAVITAGDIWKLVI